MSELWKDVPGFNGAYKVSNTGNVLSLKGKTPLLMTPNKCPGGYPTIGLCINSKKKYYRIHRLVADTFIENKANKSTVNHINGIKTDNRVENLQWTTHSENNLHAYSTGLKSGVNPLNRKTTKLTPEIVKDIRKNYKKGSQTHNALFFAKKYDVSDQCVYSVIHNQSWKDVV